MWLNDELRTKLLDGTNVNRSNARALCSGVVPMNVFNIRYRQMGLLKARVQYNTLEGRVVSVDSTTLNVVTEIPNQFNTTLETYRLDTPDPIKPGRYDAYLFDPTGAWVATQTVIVPPRPMGQMLPNNRIKTASGDANILLIQSVRYTENSKSYGHFIMVLDKLLGETLSITIDGQPFVLKCSIAYDGSQYHYESDNYIEAVSSWKQNPPVITGSTIIRVNV